MSQEFKVVPAIQLDQATQVMHELQDEDWYIFSTTMDSENRIYFFVRRNVAQKPSSKTPGEAPDNHAQLKKGWRKKVIFQYYDSEVPIRAMIAEVSEPHRTVRTSGGGTKWVLEVWKPGQRNMPFYKGDHFKSAQQAFDHFGEEIFLKYRREELNTPGQPTYHAR